MQWMWPSRQFIRLRVQGPTCTSRWALQLVARSAGLCPRKPPQRPARMSLTGRVECADPAHSTAVLWAAFGAAAVMRRQGPDGPTDSLPEASRTWPRITASATADATFRANVQDFLACTVLQECAGWPTAGGMPCDSCPLN